MRLSCIATVATMRNSGVHTRFPLSLSLCGAVLDSPEPQREGCGSHSSSTSLQFFFLHKIFGTKINKEARRYDKITEYQEEKQCRITGHAHVAILGIELNSYHMFKR